MALWTWNLLPWAPGALQGCHWLRPVGAGLAGVRGPAEMPGCGVGGEIAHPPPARKFLTFFLWVCELMSKCGGCIL